MSICITTIVDVDEADIAHGVAKTEEFDFVLLLSWIVREFEDDAEKAATEIVDLSTADAEQRERASRLIRALQGHA